MLAVQFTHQLTGSRLEEPSLGFPIPFLAQATQGPVYQSSAGYAFYWEQPLGLTQGDRTSPGTLYLDGNF